MKVAKSLMVLLTLVFAALASLAATPFMFVGLLGITYSQAVDGRDAVPEWIDAAISACCEPVADFAAWVHEVFGQAK